MPSMRSAAELKAPTTASEAALARSAADDAGILQGGDVLLQPADLVHRFRQLVGDHQRRHDGQPRVADLAKLAAQLDDALVDILGERLQMLFLPVLAGEAELAAGDGGD